MAFPGVPLRHRLRALLAERPSFSLISCSALLFLFLLVLLFLDFSAASCEQFVFAALE